MTGQPICSNQLRKTPGGFIYGAPRKLNGFWSVGLTPQPAKTERGRIENLSRAGTPLELREFAANVSPEDALRALIEPHLVQPRARITPAPAKVDISELPLDELPTTNQTGVFAVFISGDGGWRTLDKTLGEDLQQRGISVVGLDSLRYFWSKRTPDETTDVVAALMRTFMGRWHADTVMLMGCSFGAEVMPFAYDRLPSDLRAHVVMITLLGLAKLADFQISLGSWLGQGPGSDALPVIPVAEKIPAD